LILKFKEKRLLILFLFLILQINHYSVEKNDLEYNENTRYKKNINFFSSNGQSINNVFNSISYSEDILKTIKPNKTTTIAIIDSGINKSNIDNFWVNDLELPDNFIDDDQNGYVDDYYGWDFNENKSIGFSGNFSSHGTFVANIISKMVSNSSNINIMDIRVLDKANINEKYYDFVKAIQYALSFPDVKVIQFSIEFFKPLFGNYPSLLHWIFTKAYFQHVPIITVTGNNGKDSISEPGYWIETISVTSVQKIGNIWYKANYANYGKNIDISAPGNDIISIDGSGNELTLSGTSFSAAFVGGAVLLLQASDETKNMSIETIRNLIQNSALNLKNCNQFGAGLLNITNLFKLAFSNNQDGYNPICSNLNTIPTNLDPINTNTANSQIYFEILALILVISKKKIMTKLKRP
jgi:hypothetical protein